MHTWTKSACIVLACIIMPAVVVAAGRTGSVHPAQASTRTASSTEVILTSTLSAAAAPVTAARPAARYVVQPGDTLSGIAARLAVRGGWPALYAANRPRIGPDPDVIHPGTVLVLPGRKAPVRYRVVAGDTLAAIAAALAVRGGWPALYAANRRVIGPDPNAIRPGTVLTVARPAALSPATPSPAGSAPRRPAPPPSAPAGAGHRPSPASTGAPPAAGMLPWLTILLLAAGLLIAAAFLAGPVLLIRRRRRAAARGVQPGTTGPGHVPGPGAGRPGAGKARIVLADHDQIVVTRSQPDGTVYVLRPPGAAPEEILRVARLVLPEVLYGELADQLGVPAGLPMDYMVPAQVGSAGPWRRGDRRGGGGGGGGDRRGRGGVGRSRSVAGAIRPVLAAARVHPAGVAVPSAVLVTGIVLFTFVKSATIRVAPPPGSCGPGSVAAAAPGTGQPALPGSPGQNARSLTGSLGQIASPLPVLAAVPPAGPGRAPQVSRSPSSRLPGGGLVCDVRQVPSSAATAAAGSGG